MPDVVGRAWGNRGNARSRQGKLQEALADYNEAIRICPWSGDPVLNRYAHSRPLLPAPRSAMQAAAQKRTAGWQPGSEAVLVWIARAGL